MIAKILEFCDNVEREQGHLQPILDEYSRHVLQKEKKRDNKKRKTNQLVTGTPHKPITIKEEVARLRAWSKSKNHTPSVGFIHQHIFNSNYPVDVLDDLRNTKIEQGWRRQRTAQLYTKLTHLSRYIEPVDRTDIDRTVDPLDPKARCYNCGLFIQLKYKANRKIPDRTEVCGCNSGRIQREKMDAHISQKREDWTAEKKRKQRQKEKHKRHIERSAVHA